jgi:hypothetical protein
MHRRHDRDFGEIRSADGSFRRRPVRIRRRAGRAHPQLFGRGFVVILRDDADLPAIRGPRQDARRPQHHVVESRSDQYLFGLTLRREAPLERALRPVGLGAAHGHAGDHDDPPHFRRAACRHEVAHAAEIHLIHAVRSIERTRRSGVDHHIDATQRRGQRLGLGQVALYPVALAWPALPCAIDVAHQQSRLCADGIERRDDVTAVVAGRANDEDARLAQAARPLGRGGCRHA